MERDADTRTNRRHSPPTEAQADSFSRVQQMSRGERVDPRRRRREMFTEGERTNKTALSAAWRGWTRRCSRQREGIDVVGE